MSETTLRIPALRLGLNSGRIGLILGLVLMAAFLALGLSPLVFDLPPPEQIDLLSRLSGPSSVHPLGADHLGRDVLSRLIAAVPVSLGAALVTMTAILAISLPWGIIASLAGGRVDMVMTVSYTHLTLPTILLV